MNQIYACENPRLLNDILKTELGFKGYVMSDFFATHSGVKSIEGGVDKNMPGPMDKYRIGDGNSYFRSNAIDAVNNGSLLMGRLDDLIRRILTPYFALHQDEGFPTIDPSSAQVLATAAGGSIPASEQIMARDVRGNYSSLIREIGSAGVLLKNVNSILPLASPKTIGVFGNDVAEPSVGLTFDTNPAISTLDIGGGSGSGRHTSIVSPLGAIKTRAQQIGARVMYITGNDVLAANDFRSVYPTPEVCIVFIKSYASEGFDRESFIEDWDSTVVVDNVTARCANTIIVTHSSGITGMPWESNENVKAIIAAYLLDEQTGNSIVDILWGDVTPLRKAPRHNS